MAKPVKFSGRTGTIVKNIVLKSRHKHFRNAAIISDQAKKSAPKLEEKISEDTLKWSAYDSKARRHAHQKELEKIGIEVEKISFNKFRPKDSNLAKPTENNFVRSELMIGNHQNSVLGKQDFSKDNLPDNK